jgi:hypothetical protein
MRKSFTFGLALASALLTSPALVRDVHAQHDEHATTRSEFVDTVRLATAAFRDSRNVPAGYGAVLGCVSGPLEGAMGVHFVNPGLLTDADLNAAHPEALIYEFQAASVASSASNTSSFSTCGTRRIPCRIRRRSKDS